MAVFNLFKTKYYKNKMVRNMDINQLVDCVLKEIEEYKILEEKQNEIINKYRNMTNKKSVRPSSKTNQNLQSTSL